MGRLPREVFKPAEDEDGVYLYLSNRILNGESELGAAEQKQFISILNSVISLYSIECLSAVVRNNSLHLVVYVPNTQLSPDKITELIPGIADTESRCENSNNPGILMKELQSSFTRWYNRTRPKRRNGSYWKERYKCTRLTDETALLCCILYLERDLSSELPEAVLESRKRHLDDQNLNIKLEPCRNWTDGLAIGSRASLRRYAERLWGPERAKIKRFGKIYKDENIELYSMRQLIK